MTKKTKGTKKKWLIFVDANILLDFYRLAGESAERQLKALERHKESLILSDQLRMEYMNHRQRAIIAGIEKVTKPQRPSLPAVLLDSQDAKMWIKNHETAEAKFQKVKRKIETILKDPFKADPVYQHLTRIFDADSRYNLRRADPERYKQRFSIRALARKRFMLGYPPRKASATSLGDALHWEWIISCAQQSTELHNILIVSRDGDYGVTYSGRSILNDWLYREFKERVSMKRDIDLTQKLTDALTRLDEQVAPADLEEEKRLIHQDVQPANVLLRSWLTSDAFTDEARESLFRVLSSDERKSDVDEL